MTTNTATEDAIPTDQPVTVLIRRRVKPGCEAAYEDWLTRLQRAARTTQPGYLGVTTQRPGPTGPREYLVVVRFDNVEHLRAFETSDFLAGYLKEVHSLVDGDAIWERMTGLEFWFSAPAGTVVPHPSRPRMALVMIAVVFTLVLVIGSAVNAAFDHLPFATPAALKLLVTITIEVILMTWWVMPWVTRRLATWIYPAS